MKSTIYLLAITLLLFNCSASKTVAETPNLNDISQEDIVRIENKDIEYEIIIIEPGFNYWLASIAKPRDYYTQQYMENRNWIFVQEWNNRVLLPQRYNSSLYELQIDYQSNIDYGYDVNYKLYNYFIYFQLTYKQQLSTFVPRI